MGEFNFLVKIKNGGVLRILRATYGSRGEKAPNWADIGMGGGL
ncbi:hypothetical protein [Poseidonocella sedimentorum]|nr:hypothetical protein [Poseidonocella sedimentorum]